MRTNLIRRERKSGYRLVSVIRCGKLASPYTQLFQNKNVVLCSFLSSFCLSDNSKLGSSSSLASRNNLVRILRNTRGLPCSGFPVPYLHNPIFAPHLHLPRFLSHTGQVFGKMESLFCSEYPRFLRYRFSSESSQVRDVSVLLDLISSIFHFCYNAPTMGLSLNERIFSTAIVRHGYCRFLAANDTERPSSRNPAHANSSEFSIVLDANQGFKTSQNSPGISLNASASLESEKPFVFSSLLSLSGIRFTEFCNFIFKALNFFCCFFNRSDKFFAFNVIFNRKDNTHHRSGASDKCTQEHHIFPAVFVLVNIRQQEKNKKYCSCEDGIEDRFIEIFFEIRHFLFLRGLNRNLSLQTKVYSSPRRHLFLGALGKARALLAPRACLKTMLLQAFTSRFIAWSQYLCIAKFSSHLFRTRSGRIGQRRCFLFLRAADCPKMIGENGGTKC